jgi:two-component system, chemotaxis family, sensor kinase CheA
MLEKELANDGGNLISANVVATVAVPEISSANSKGWKIYFKPNGNVLQTGNDPLPLLRELADLGSIEIESDITGLPNFQVYDCENCYLSWNLKLETDTSLDEINELFA